MSQAVEVARYLLKLAADEPERDFLTHLRLQKLLYYAQAWSLAFRDRPLFDSRIEAWRHGPVVRAVVPAFRDYGDEPIPFREASSADDLTADDRALVKSVWRAYGRYTGPQLRRMTHKHQPWIDAWNRRHEDDRCDEEITQDAMKKYFSERYEKRNKFVGLDLDSIRRAERDFQDRRRGVRLQDAIKHLRHAI